MKLTEVAQEEIIERLKSLGACPSGVSWMKTAMRSSTLREIWENCESPEFLAWILWQVPTRAVRYSERFQDLDVVLGAELMDRYGFECGSDGAIIELVDTNMYHDGYKHYATAIRDSFPWSYVGPLILEGFGSDENPDEDHEYLDENGLYCDPNKEEEEEEDEL